MVTSLGASLRGLTTIAAVAGLLVTAPSSTSACVARGSPGVTSSSPSCEQDVLCLGQTLSAPRHALRAALEAHQQLEEGGHHATNGHEKFYHGTTTCSFVFDHGILVAVDSRASIGSYIGTRAAQKVIPVSTRILGTMAGGAADCSFWLRHLAMQVRLHELENERSMTVARASKLLANRLAKYMGRLSVGTMIMGYDDQEGFSIYYVDNEGVRIKGNLFAVGSGSTYAYSILDAEYRPDMSVEAAKTLGLRAVRHATYRDAFSGGYINLYLIRKDGWERIARVDSGYLDLHAL